MGSVGPVEIAILLVIALLVVGPRRLPALGRSVGEGLRELREGVDLKAAGRDRADEGA